MESHDLISVIVPVYNVAPYLRKCLDSLCAQTYQNLEILVVDDGSTDESGRICDEYAKCHSQIRVFHTENHGLSAARNDGLNHATGTYVGFVDSDDWVEPETFETLHRLITVASAEMSSCGMFWAYNEHSSSRAHTSSENTCQQKEAFTRAAEDEQFYGYVCNKLYRRDIIGEQRFDEMLLSLEDYDFTAAFLAKIKFAAFTNAPLYNYRQRGDSMTGDFNYNFRKLSILDAYEKIMPLYQEYDPETVPLLRRNYLKISINIQGRMRLSHVEDEAVAKRLQRIIADNYKLVIHSKQVSVGEKANIYFSKLFPGLMLKGKQTLLKLRNQSEARKDAQ